MALGRNSNIEGKKMYDQATPIPLKFLHPDGTISDSLSGSSESMKYHLYAWDYGDGFCIGYTEKEVPVAGDLVYLKWNMEEGKITNLSELKLIYHIVSDNDGVITVSEHPEGQSGYTFRRDANNDYEETINGINSIIEINQTGLLFAPKNKVLKSLNVKAGGSKLYAWKHTQYDDIYYTFHEKVEFLEFALQGTRNYDINILYRYGGPDGKVNHCERYPEGDIEFDSHPTINELKELGISKWYMYKDPTPHQYGSDRLWYGFDNLDRNLAVGSKFIQLEGYLNSGYELSIIEIYDEDDISYYTPLFENFVRDSSFDIIL